MEYAIRRNDRFGSLEITFNEKPAPTILDALKAAKFRWNRRGGKSYQFPFYDSAYNTQRGERPTAYDVLACIEKYEPYGDVWDFASEYGYTIEDRESFQRVERIFKACQTQARKIERLFGDVMDELYEIV